MKVISADEFFFGERSRIRYASFRRTFQSSTTDFGKIPHSLSRSMEIIELLFGSAQACGCLFDVLTVLIDIWAGTSSYRFVKSRGKKPNDRPQDAKVVLLILLVAMAVIFTFVLLVRWLGPTRR